MNIGKLLPTHTRFRPHHLAVVFQDQRLTFRKFNRRVNRLANALVGLGIKKGDKVATILPNCIELLEAYWGAAKIGAVVVPLSPLLRGKGLMTLLNDSDTAVVFTVKDFVGTLDEIKSELPALPPDRYFLTDAGSAVPRGYRDYLALTATAGDGEPPEVEIGNADPYNIIYSSGTTGLPKGIVLTHYVRSLYAMLFGLAWRMTPESVVCHAGSLVFNGAFLTLLPAIYLGTTYVLLHHFDPELLIETIAQEKVTHIYMVPAQIVALLNSPAFSASALQSLEMIGTVGAPFHKEHREELNRRLPGVFYELYGLTEGGIMTILDKTHYATKPLSVGAPPPFFELKILDEQGKPLPPGQVGEIVGRGPMMMAGYYKRPELTQKAIVEGWLYSGDMGYLDEDGFLYLVDRQKDMIVSGGVNVFPRDIEEIIVQHPAVREAAVFGIPSEKWGESPLAAVILRQPGAATSEELRDWINARVAARYQQVAGVVLMDDFPRSVTGKTLKRVMREPYWAGRETRI